MSFDLIPVHDKDEGKEIMVNVHFIAFMVPEDTGTCIEMSTGSVLYVKETWEELGKLVGYMQPIWKAIAGR